MSPRPKKPRICACPHRPPGCSVFKPAGIPLKDLSRIDLHHDELEALRLCDSEGLSQEAAGTQMGVSRGTVQRLVIAGRKKVVDAIVTVQALVLEPDGAEDN
jgi:uncharacterized protein